MKLLKCYQNPWHMDSLIIPIPDVFNDPNDPWTYPILTIWKPDVCTDPNIDDCFLEEKDLLRKRYSSEYPYLDSFDIYETI